MYDDLKANTTNRVVEIREVIEFIKPIIPVAPKKIPRHLNTLKGMIYVQLYGLVEYTILQIVSQTIEHINNANINLSQLKPSLYSLALHPNLDSLKDANRAKWDKRYELFRSLEIDNVVKISETLLPTDGRNIQDTQLKSICNIFCINKPYYPDVKFLTSLKEIVGHRINIAHGNLTAAQIGSGVEIDRLELRLDETSKFCSHIIELFDDYVTAAEYKA
jgi:HEPN superfamily protein